MVTEPGDISTSSQNGSFNSEIISAILKKKINNVHPKSLPSNDMSSMEREVPKHKQTNKQTT
jgi:hypothetical protein